MYAARFWLWVLQTAAATLARLLDAHADELGDAAEDALEPDLGRLRVIQACAAKTEDSLAAIED